MKENTYFGGRKESVLNKRAECGRSDHSSTNTRSFSISLKLAGISQPLDIGLHHVILVGARWADSCELEWPLLMHISLSEWKKYGC